MASAASQSQSQSPGVVESFRAARYFSFGVLLLQAAAGRSGKRKKGGHDAGPAASRGAGPGRQGLPLSLGLPARPTPRPGGED
jgi:hypothetical protein